MSPERSDRFVADGHRLVVKVAGGALDGHVECPGEACKFRSPEYEGCGLQMWVADVGMYEFSEWQERPYMDADLPCEIEWIVDGDGEDAELFWRPVRPT